MGYLTRHSPEVLPLGLETEAAQTRLTELRARPLVYQAPFEDLVDNTLRMSDDIAPGFYNETYLGKLLVGASDRLANKDMEGVVASVRTLESRRESVLRLNDDRVLVITPDDQERQRTWDIADAVNKLVQHIQGGSRRVSYTTGLPWATCYDIAENQGLLPVRTSDKALFTKLLESHRQVVLTEEDIGIAAIAAKYEVDPYSIGEALDCAYNSVDMVAVRSGNSLVSPLVAVGGLPTVLRGDLAEAMRLDTRLGYLGFNGINEYFMISSDDLPDPHNVRAIAHAARITGDILVMRDMHNPDRLRRGEAPLLALRYRLLDEISPEQRQLFDRLLYLHPALTRRNPGKKPLAPQLNEYADAYREQVLFKHIPPERQNELLTEFYVSFGELAAQQMLEPTLSREEVLETFDRSCGLEVTDYDFIEKCILPRIFRWRAHELNEYAGRHRHIKQNNSRPRKR
jgi:hypothetical protein